MAYRRLAWMSKGLIPTLAYGSLRTIPRNHNDDSTFSASTGSFFLPYSSTLSKDQFYFLNLLSVVKNASKFPPGKEEFLEKVEAKVPANNVNDAEKDDKRLMDLANDICRQMLKIEEKLEEVDKLIGEMIVKLRGFGSLLTWNTEDEKLIFEEKKTRITNIMKDVITRNTKCNADKQRLRELIKVRGCKSNADKRRLYEKLTGVREGTLRIDVVNRRAAKKIKKLNRMLRRRKDLQFCLSITVGGR